MKNIKSFRCISFILILLLALSSVTFGAEDLSQSELDDLISRVEKGDPEAQFELSLMYARGGIIRQDEEQAFYWCKKSAEQGHEEARKALIERVKIKFIEVNNQSLSSKAQQDTAFQIYQIENSLALYHMHNGFYPSTEQGF